jgi:hypothetical protein
VARPYSGCDRLASVSVPETVYAKSGGGRIGYQVVGAGPPDVLVTRYSYFPVDLMWDEPKVVRFLMGCRRSAATFGSTCGGRAHRMRSRPWRAAWLRAPPTT